MPDTTIVSMPASVPRLRWKRVLYIILGCISIVFISAIVSFFELPSGVDYLTVFHQLPDQDGVFFLGHVFQVDVPDRVVSVSWLIGGCGNLRLQTAGTFSPRTTCGPANVPIDVYINGKFQFNYDPTIHPTEDPPPTGTNISIVAVEGLTQFTHTHTMNIGSESFSNTSSHPFEQRFFFPFEDYILQTTFVAFNTATNTSIPIVRLACTDTANNFEPQDADEYTTLTRLNNTLLHSRTTHVHFKRSTTARTFVMLLFLLNWLLAGTVIYITSIALWSNTQLGEGVLLLPMTTILTIPALRQLFVESPPFGIFLDSLGLIIQMIIVATCNTILLLGLKIKRKQAQEVNLKNDDDITKESVVHEDCFPPEKSDTHHHVKPKATQTPPSKKRSLQGATAHPVRRKKVFRVGTRLTGSTPDHKWTTCYDLQRKK